MKPLFTLSTPEGKFASYDMRSGPYLAPSKAWAYTWPTKAEAEAQLAFYVKALGVSLTVSEFSK